MSIKKNFAYSSVLTIAGYIFPMITFPYVTRVLGVEYFGLCNFVDSTIQYFCIIAMMGVNTVGIREISKARGNRLEMSRVFSSLLTINLIMTFFSILILFLLTLIIPKLYEQHNLLYIGSARILFSSLLIEWLYRGIENFKFITIRSVVIRLFYVAAVFIFVKAPDDYVIYFILTVLTVVFNAAINLFYSRHFVSFTPNNITFKPYVKPFITLGVYHILTSMYISFNVTYLGISCGDVEVGYYTTATKLYTIIISLFTAFTGVMLPRMSSLIANDNFSEFIRLTRRSVDALLAFVMPLIVITELYAPQIINLLAGEGYEGAIIPMRIVMPLMLVIGYEQVIIIQILTPLEKDKAILINSFWGALAALILNFLIVPKMGSIGSSIVWFVCELVVLFSAQFFVNKYFNIKFPFITFSKRILSIVPIFVVCLFLNTVIKNSFFVMIVGCLIILSYYFMIECLLFKNEVVISSINQILSKWKKRFR